MARSTRATLFLQKAGVAFSLHAYEYLADAPNIGLQAAEALGEMPDRVFKTLMARVEGQAACVIVPSSGEVSMKRLAAALGGKSAAMMKPEDAERHAGYKIGGISPFGQSRPTRTIVDESALRHELIYLNGGQRGLQIRIAPGDVIRLLNATVAPILA